MSALDDFFYTKRPYEEAVETCVEDLGAADILNTEDWQYSDYRSKAHDIARQSDNWGAVDKLIIEFLQGYRPEHPAIKNYEASQVAARAELAAYEDLKPLNTAK